MNQDLKIVKTLPSTSLIEDLLDLYLEAFRQKVVQLEFMTDRIDAIRNILKENIDTDHGYYAVENGRLLGFLGIDDGENGRFYTLKLKPLMKNIGPLKGLWQYITQKIFDDYKVHSPSALRVECVAVGKEARGKGIGTKLFEAFEKHGKELGRSAYVLEVIDTNPGAMTLYERLGYTVYGHKHYGSVTKPGGFEGIYLMRKELGE